MPAVAKYDSRTEMWRVKEAHSNRLVRNAAGTPVDGGGHGSYARANAQARAINARQGGYPKPARKTRRR